MLERAYFNDVTIVGYGFIPYPCKSTVRTSNKTESCKYSRDPCCLLPATIHRDSTQIPASIIDHLLYCVMSFLFALPDELQATVLAEWLGTWISVGRLDSAVCNKKERHVFWRLLSQPMCTLRCYYGSFSRVPMKWIVDRGMWVANISLDEAFLRNPEHSHRALSHFGDKVESVAIHYDFRDVYKDNFDGQCLVLRDTTNYCINVKSLSVFGDGYNNYDRLIALTQYISSLPLLTQIVMYNAFIAKDVFSFLCEHQSLTLVHLHGCQLHSGVSDCTTKNLHVESLSISSDVRLCSHFPNITSLNVSGVLPDQVNLLAEHCKCLVDVSIHMMVDNTTPAPYLSHSIVCAMAATWTQLQSLKLNNGYRTMSEASVVAFIKLCPSITSFDMTIEFPLCIDGRLKVAYPVHYTGSHLAVLSINCSAASTLQAITSYCPYLHTLSIQKRPTLHSEENLHVETALQYIAKTNITKLVMCGYDSLSDIFVQALDNMSITNLTIIDSGDVLTTTGIANLVRTLPKLENLCLIRCHGVKCDVLRLVPPLCPILRSFSFIRACRSEHKEETQLCVALLHQLYPHIAFTVRF